MFQNIPTTVGLGGAIQAITAATTAPSITTTITTVIGTTGGAHTGTISETSVVQGQIKHIVQIVNFTNTSTLAVTTGVGISQIVFNAIGDSVTLMWTGVDQG